MPERIRIRNTVARSAFMRKGGAHVQSKSGVRQRTKLAVDDAVDEWWQSQLDHDEWTDAEESPVTSAQ